MIAIHPTHAMLLAKNLHHELVTRAQDFRLARRAEQAGASADCRIPTAATVNQPCRPDPRRAALRGHRKPRLVR